MILDDLTNLEEVKYKIKSLEDEIEKLKDEYSSLVPPCNNKDCSFHSTFHKNHCCWTFYVDECPKYK